jgi:FdhD protein
MTGRTARRLVRRIRLEPPLATERTDIVAAEEPLGIRIGGQAVTLTMRTPGDDLDLTAGFLVSEGIISAAEDIASIQICGTTCGHADHDLRGAPGGRPPGPAQSGNIADVELRPDVLTGPPPRRNFLTTSACGVCGKASLEELRVTDKFHLSGDDMCVSPATLATMADTLRRAQRVFERTGGLHAAGVFTADGELLAAREDVGRHNAVDKVVGWALRAGRLPLTGCVLLVSGRASFELVAKAVLAGIPVLAAVSAPSSLAAQLAEESGLTLVGFLRGGSMNVYTGSHRVG